MIKFEKVSEEQFIKDTKNLFPEMEENEIKEIYEQIELPKRGSVGSAGYDIYSPFNFILNSNPITIPTGIRAVMPSDIYLQIVLP